MPTTYDLPFYNEPRCPGCGGFTSSGLKLCSHCQRKHEEEKVEPELDEEKDEKMKISRLIELLESKPDQNVHIRLPPGNFIPEHFHVTEVGRVKKEFIDCGGTCRGYTACVLQVWLAKDFDHRLLAGKLAKILKLASDKFEIDDLPIEIEYGATAAVHFFVKNIEITPKGILLELSGKKTDCLAPDKCGVSDCC